MDLLNAVGMTTKRRSDYFRQAKGLARKYKSQPALESRMKIEALSLVKGLRDKLMRWDEYERTLIDKTLISALSSVILGSDGNKINVRLEKAWPIVIGDMLPPLIDFLKETKEQIDSGKLRLGDQTADFADPAEEEEGDTPERAWPALSVRVARYIANPTFSFFSLGQYFTAQDQGFKEMRRVAKLDKKCCSDCKGYDKMGWQPLGEIPMPGRGCRCYDHCRCDIEYR